MALCLPGTLAAQGTSSLAYRPNLEAVRINARADAAVAQDTVAVDPYAIDNTVVYGAAVGGILGGLAVAVHTLSDDDRQPMSWTAAVGLPILGGLIGAGVGYLLR